MREKLYIGKPYLEDNDSHSRLCAEISCPSYSGIVFYEVGKQYKSYLCWERADAFYLALLQYAMIKDYDIVSSAPITEDLLFQTTTYYMPILANSLGIFHSIGVEASGQPPIQSEAEGIGTGFSCGVDSFYSVLKMRDNALSEFNLTFLMFANVNALTFIPETAQKIFEEKSRKFEQIAKDLGLDFVAINTNLLDVHGELLNSGVTAVSSACKTCSCLYAIQKMVQRYYFASGLPIEDFRLDEEDPAYYDIFTLPLISSQNLTIYSSGIERTSRMEKLGFIADEEIVQKNLCVCAGTNCGRCAKCLRTQFELCAMGKLGNYKEVFDTDDFIKHMPARLGKLFSYRREWIEGYTQESIKRARMNHIHVPMRAWLYCLFFFAPARFVHKIFKNTGWYRRLYYGKGLDVLIAGQEAADLNRPKDV